MPRLDPIGRVAKPTAPDPDAEPIVVPIIGYRAERVTSGKNKGDVVRDVDGHPVPEEVEIEVRFLPMSPTGLSVRSMSLVDALERAPRDDADAEARSKQLGVEILSFLSTVIHDDDRRALIDFVSAPDIEVSMDTLAQLYRTLTAYYSGRPTSLRPVSHNGRATTGATSRAAASSRASTSARSRSSKG